MALSVTVDADSPSKKLNRGWGDYVVVTGFVQFDADYASGGETYTLTDFDDLASELVEINFEPSEDTPPSHVCQWDQSASKFVVTQISDGAQVAGSADLSADDGKFRFQARIKTTKNA